MTNIGVIHVQSVNMFKNNWFIYVESANNIGKSILLSTTENW